ncbi:MAG TPA: bifunctional DNA primase/polymerase [Holophaga sp.]|nr:bifunctional DNA primase/polymerase [Holophaga sp.]
MTLRAAYSAVRLRGMGFFPFPLGDHDARDLKAFKRPRYSGWQAIATTAEDFRLAHWDEQGWNLGLFLRPSRLVVLDSDTLEAEAWASGKLPETPWMTRTAQGRHRFYRLAEGQGTPVDNKPVPGLDRKAAGYVLAPGSWHHGAGVPYQPEGDWNAPILALPVYDPRWFPELRKPDVQCFPAVGVIHPNRDMVLRRAQAWLARVEPAVSGQGGHLQTFKTAVGLVRGFCLDPDDALALLWNDFNPRCAPPWPLADLRRKVEQARAARLTAGGDGWLLNARRSA